MTTLPQAEALATNDELVASASALLHASGESTAVTLLAVERMNRGLHSNLEMFPEWSTVTVVDRAAPHTSMPQIQPAAPVGIAMNVVATLMRTIDSIGAGKAGRAELVVALADARRQRPSPLWLFLLACVTGSTALAIIFGADDLISLSVIAVSAVLGGLTRRLLGTLHVGAIGQVFAAALVAGLIGGAAVNADLSSSLRLIAVCPAMILMPGPHILNAGLDLLHMRIPLGFARLGFAGLVLLSIGTGLAIGLAAFGTTLPPTPPGRDVQLWVDVIAAAIAAASFPVYFSMPLRYIAWPIAAGAIAHGVRWVAMEMWGWDIMFGGFVACLLVGAMLAPVARAKHIPFAGIGFASVVSLIPGVYVFRLVDALAATTAGVSSSQLLGAAADGATALFIIVAMIVGLVLPMRVYDLLRPRAAR